MQGGDVQTMSIKPSDVKNGTFTTTRKITGVQAGAWSATATVVIFNVCLQDDNNGNTLILSSETGDYVFCKIDPKSGASDARVRTDGVMDFHGGLNVQTGDFTGRGIHVQLDVSSHTGSATIQPASSKQKFTITDRDTRNYICTCK